MAELTPETIERLRYSAKTRQGRWLEPDEVIALLAAVEERGRSLGDEQIIDELLAGRDRLQARVETLEAEMRSIIRHATHANHKYQTCGVCMAKRAMGGEVQEAFVRNLPPRAALAEAESER
jgi:hypothetical protein